MNGYVISGAADYRATRMYDEPQLKGIRGSEIRDFSAVIVETDTQAELYGESYYRCILYPSRIFRLSAAIDYPFILCAIKELAMFPVKLTMFHSKTNLADSLLSYRYTGRKNI